LLENKGGGVRDRQMGQITGMFHSKGTPGFRRKRGSAEKINHVKAVTRLD